MALGDFTRLPLMVCVTMRLECLSRHGYKKKKCCPSLDDLEAWSLGPLVLWLPSQALPLFSIKHMSWELLAHQVATHSLANIATGTH